MIQLRLSGLAKSFGGFQAIKGVDLSVEKGEFCALLGPSGCGKSTLLRLIAGLETPTGGKIEIAGRDVTRAEPVERQIAMVFQSYALYPHMTVAENIAFSLEAAGVAKAPRMARAEEVARQLHLDQLLARKPAALSGGQRQRVAIGRALVRDPAVFLFDEPLSNLDALLRVQMRIELSNLHREIGATMVYVTHDQVEAMTMADKIMVMNGGAVQQVGAPMDLYLNPANRFVAGFIGNPAMNFLPRDGGTMGLRPEDLRLAEDGRLPGRIKLVERLGSVTLAHIETGHGLICVQAPGQSPARPGQPVALEWDDERAFFFDATGQRVDAPR